MSLWEEAIEQAVNVVAMVVGDVGSALMKEVLGDATRGAAGAAVIAGIHSVSGLRRLLGRQPEPRSLTGAERATLEPIFGKALQYEAIRITEGNLGVLGIGGRPYTVGYDIYVPSASGRVPLSRYPETLVHEAVHVWQFEHGGPAYVPEAVWAQLFGRVGRVNAGRGYDFDNALAAGKHFEQFNPEQQAMFIQYAYAYGVDFANPDAGRFEVLGIDRKDELVHALALIRAGRGAP